MAEKKLILTFSPDQVDSPLTFRMAKDYDLDISILRAEVNERGGKLILSLKGTEDSILKAIAFLEDNKVQVGEVARFVIRDESRCTDCSMCISICPVRAYKLNKASWKVQFEQERCIACGMCVDACPAMALECGNHLTQTV
ncbi:MAG: 4Fe-4S binding protein [Methanomassiliicoccus sp.]|nr:4Fe-4S binding protein [Methanomassiliicoccus sp.]